jgi:hypothetical protein
MHVVIFGYLKLGDVHDGLCESLRRFLWQVVANSPVDSSVRPTHGRQPRPISSRSRYARRMVIEGNRRRPELTKRL